MPGRIRQQDNEVKEASTQKDVSQGTGAGGYEGTEMQFLGDPERSDL